MEMTDSSYPLHDGMMRMGARGLSGISQASEEDLLWMGIGFSEAIFLLGLVCLIYLCYQHCECRRVPNKIAAQTPDLPAGVTGDESDDGGSSRRLAAFFQNQHHNAPNNGDAMSEVSQSDVWSFSLKSFSGMDRPAAGYEREYEDEDEEDQSFLEDSTFDASLYTSNRPVLIPPLPEPTTTVEHSTRTVRRAGTAPTVEV